MQCDIGVDEVVHKEMVSWLTEEREIKVIQSAKISQKPNLRTVKIK